MLGDLLLLIYLYHKDVTSAHIYALAVIFRALCNSRSLA